MLMTGNEVAINGPPKSIHKLHLGESTQTYVTVVVGGRW